MPNAFPIPLSFVKLQRNGLFHLLHESVFHGSFHHLTLQLGLPHRTNIQFYVYIFFRGFVRYSTSSNCRRLCASSACQSEISHRLPYRGIADPLTASAAHRPTTVHACLLDSTLADPIRSHIDCADQTCRTCILFARFGLQPCSFLQNMQEFRALQRKSAPSTKKACSNCRLSPFYICSIRKACTECRL